MLSELSLVFLSLGHKTGQGAEVMGLKVKHHAAFGCPSPVCQSLLSSSSRPQRRATACTSYALNLTKAEQDNCFRAGGLNVPDEEASESILVVLTGLYATSKIWTLNMAIFSHMPSRPSAWHWN